MRNIIFSLCSYNEDELNPRTSHTNLAYAHVKKIASLLSILNHKILNINKFVYIFDNLNYDFIYKHIYIQALISTKLYYAENILGCLTASVTASLAGSVSNGAGCFTATPWFASDAGVWLLKATELRLFSYLN